MIHLNFFGSERGQNSETPSSVNTPLALLIVGAGSKFCGAREKIFFILPSFFFLPINLAIDEKIDKEIFNSCNS